MISSVSPSLSTLLSPGLAGPGLDASGPRPVTAEDARRAAGQFEAILVRQLLSPVIEPLMSGGLGGGDSSGSGGGVYSYLLTDTFANAITSGGGLGLGEMLGRQLTPAQLKTSAVTEK